MLGYVTQEVDDHVIKACKGKWLVVINNWQGACRAADAGVNVIFRWHGISGVSIKDVLNPQVPYEQYLLNKYANTPAGDNDLCDKWDAKEWLYIQEKLGRPDIWRYTSNESGLTPAVVRFHNDLTIFPSKLNFVVLNLSTGTPNYADWYLVEPLLRWAGKNPKRMKVGLHEYYYGVPYSACAGKHPMEWIPVANWPTERPEVCWHLGRFQLLMDFAMEKNFPCPEIVITEIGHDYLNDLAPHMNIPLKDGVLTARGYKTLELAWRKWSFVGSVDEVYYNMLKDAAYTMYRNTPVVGACIFRYDVGYDWHDFATGKLLPEGDEPLPKPEPEPEPEPEPVNNEWAIQVMDALDDLAHRVQDLQDLVQQWI